MQKLIITVALTGNVPTKEMNANLPVTADEIAADVRRCADTGASLFHVHARDIDEKPTLDIEVYKENVRQINAIAPEVIIQLSTGARAGKEWEPRVNPVRLLPEMASFTTGSNNLPGIIYENSPQFIEYLAGVFKKTGVKPPRYAALITVNASTDLETTIDKSHKQPSVAETISAVSNIQLHRYNDATQVLTDRSLERWAELVSTPDNPVMAYNVRVGFDDIEHPDDRSFFNRIPTSFSLSDEQVDRLIEAGRVLLRNNPNYQRLLADLGGVQPL